MKNSFISRIVSKRSFLTLTFEGGNIGFSKYIVSAGSGHFFHSIGCKKIIFEIYLKDRQRSCL